MNDRLELLPLITPPKKCWKASANPLNGGRRAASAAKLRLAASSDTRYGSAASGVHIIFFSGFIALRAIKQGHVINPADLHVERRDVTGETGYFTSTNHLLGQTMRVAVPALHIIRADNVIPKNTKQEPLIGVRDRVQIVAHTRGLRISTLGEALEAGRKGEVIRVRNVNSKKVLQARVVSRQEVLVNTMYDGVPTSAPRVGVPQQPAAASRGPYSMATDVATEPILRPLPPLENKP